jgi:hypothetical protein
MGNTKEFDFSALLKIADRQGAISDSTLDMWLAAVRVCPKWRGYWPSGNTLVEWLYNERPEIARAIEQKHKLYPDGL